MVAGADRYQTSVYGTPDHLGVVLGEADSPLLKVEAER